MYSSWPVSGIPQIIFLGNGKEFHSLASAAILKAGNIDLSLEKAEAFEGSDASSPPG